MTSFPVIRAAPSIPENLRNHLEILRGVDLQSAGEYPMGLPLCAVAIHQLAEWGETQAVPEFERILTLPWPKHDMFVEAVRGRVIEPAASALEKLKKVKSSAGCP